MGRLTLTDLDMAEAARIYADRAGATTPELKRIYGGFSLENLALSNDQGVRVKIARMAGRDFLARPTKASWMETMKTIGALDSPDKASPAEQSRLLAAFPTSSTPCRSAAWRRPASRSATPPTRSRRPAASRASPIRARPGSRPSDVRVENLEIGAKDGKARIGLIAFTGFSFAPTLAELRALGDKPITDLDAGGAAAPHPDDRHDPPLRHRLRRAERGLDGAEAREHQVLRSGDLEVTADKPVNGIPTNLRVGVQGLRMAIPADTKEEGLKELAGLGYRNLDFSWVTAATWNESGNELVRSRDLVQRRPDGQHDPARHHRRRHARTSSTPTARSRSWRSSARR